MGQQGQSDTRRFAAFVSYSHADAQTAATLQRRLERYRLPKHIIRDTGSARADLGPIFRDRDDLAAAPSLSAAIQDAIARADALLVICSPDAKASKWVDQEIALFRSLHPGRPILAVLVAGDPSTAFPASLITDGVEPLAADLREGGDGQQLGFLKIVAGIAGIPLDALIQRDAQRRLRRVTAITVGALAAMLIMAIMTTYAISARNEANRQRAEAEGLVEYMLTDLREKLKGVGRLDVMSAVNVRAMDHYHRQGELDALPTDSLERRARILHAMGEDDEMRGDLALALGKFREAHRTTAALLVQKPNDPTTIFAHAQSEYWVGYGAFLNNDNRTALHHANEYGRYAAQLKAIDPKNAHYDMEVGWADNLLGVINLYGTGNLATAEQQLSRFRDIFIGVVQKLPEDYDANSALAAAYALLAETYQRQGRLQDADKARAREAAITQRLYTRDPGNADIWRANLVRSRGIAQLLIQKSEFDRARWYLIQVESYSNSLLKLDPDNADWRHQAALSEVDFVSFYGKTGDHASARKHLEKLQNMMASTKFLDSLRPSDRAYLVGQYSKLKEG